MNPNIRDRLSCAMRLPIALAGSLGLASLASGQTTVAAVPELLRAPVPLQSANGVVDQRIDAVFGVANIKTPNGNAQMTVRAYAPPRAPMAGIPIAAIPGPTIVFNPGDLLRIRFENQLNATANPALNAFDNNIQSVGGAPGGFDDIRDHATHEISIPNDSNVTNLHVHGLHVDPKQDDVTLLILPKDYSPGNLTPELQRFVPTINRWWTRAYQYKIPADHIPGTYWYHSHKHGSTSTQVENGMAGTLLMLPKDKNDDIVPQISGTAYDRVMMIQELQNFGAAPNVGGGSTTAIATALASTPAPGSGKGGGGGGGGGGKGAGKGKANAAKAAKGRLLTTNNNVPVPVNAGGSVVTVNGQYQPTLKLPANQIERWRFILAGANHTAAGSLWVGKYTLPAEAKLPASFVAAVKGMTTVAQAQAYNATQNPTQFPTTAVVTVVAEAMPGVAKLVSVDGIPMRAPVDITPGNPTLGGAGNRFDLFVRPSAAATSGGPYFIYQNYPVPTQAQLIKDYPDLFDPAKVDNPTGQPAQPGLAAARYTAVATGTMTNGSSVFLPSYSQKEKDKDGKEKDVVVPVANAFATDFYALGTNYSGLSQQWFNVDASGAPLASTTNAPNPVTMSVAPLLKAKLRGTTKGVEIEEPKSTLSFPSSGRWQAMPDGPGGATPTAAVLAIVDTSGTAVKPLSPDPLDSKTFAARVSSLSPAGTGSALKRVNKIGQLETGIPSYVAPIKAVDGHQVAVFDRGQFTFDYTDKVTGSQQQFRQFWISGRQFNIDDSVGNPDSTKLIQAGLVDVEPSLGRYNPAAAANAWTHQVAPPVGSDGKPKILVTNPAYFRGIKTFYAADGKTVTGYNYDYSSYTPPTAATLSGIDTPPSLPKSRTAEEWVLINNSDLYHPFHIHISPFFVEEVGQLNYTAGTGGAQGTWNLNKVTWNGKEAVFSPKTSASKFGWVVGSWWDVIMLPPHGYVRMKTWINVPDQVPLNPADPNSDLVVVDNSNTYGSWVFHCHILRHEDRGMMSMVNTNPNPVVLGPTWYDNRNTSGTVTSTTYSLLDSHGGLRAQAGAGSTPFGGTFNQGLGNPFISQPYAGAMNFPASAGGAATFCVPESAQLIVFSNGSQWSTAKTAPAYTPPPSPAVYIDLTGTWTDDTASKNQAKIVQTQVSTPSTQGATAPPVLTGAVTITPVNAGVAYPVWWNGASGTWNAGGQGATTTNLGYGGSATFALTQGNQTVRNQFLGFCVTSDGKKIVFNNGITWTKN